MSSKNRRSIAISIIDGGQIMLYIFYLSAICVMKYLKIDDRQRLVGHLFFMNTIGLSFFSLYGLVYYFIYKSELRGYYSKILLSTSIISILIIVFIIILTILWIKQFDLQHANNYLIYGNEKYSVKSDTSRVSCR
jgi:type IV secretory pathway TraG/TraD family ATPase VirD4